MLCRNMLAFVCCGTSLLLLYQRVSPLGNSVNTADLLLTAVTTFGDGCFAMPSLLASLPTEKGTHEAAM
jgi:hypothetical protein